jgi:hypothetical protein
MRTWELMRQALASVLRSRTRSALTILGVAIACGALVSMVAFAVGLQEKIEAPFQELGLLNNIEVFPRPPRNDRDHRHDHDETSPSERLVLDDDTLTRFEKIPGVDYAYPDLRLSSVEVRHGEQKQSAYAMGVAREITSSVVYEDRSSAWRAVPRSCWAKAWRVIWDSTRPKPPSDRRSNCVPRDWSLRVTARST